MRDLTGGLGADLVVEASGAEPAIRQAIEMVRIDGRICGLGISGTDALSFAWDSALKKAVHLTFSFSSAWTSWERALSMMSTGRVNPDPLITRTFSLEEWKKGFDPLERLEVIKVLLIP